MPYAPKIILHCASGVPQELGVLVEEFISDGVKFVGVVGKRASHVEDLIDEMVVGDGIDQNRYILTSSHEGESIEEAIEFANALSGEYAGNVQVVEV